MAQKRNPQPNRKKTKKAPKIKFETIVRDDGEGNLAEPYALAFDLLRGEPDHVDLAELAFSLVWKYGGDRDDPIPVLKTTIHKEPTRAKTGEDFYIIIPYEWYRDALVTIEDKFAYLDDAFCQVRVVRGEDGEYVRDAKGRLVLRKAPPDFAGYLAAARRRGAYTPALRSAAAAFALQARGGRPDADAPVPPASAAVAAALGIAVPSAEDDSADEEMSPAVVVAD